MLAHQARMGSGYRRNMKVVRERLAIVSTAREEKSLSKATGLASAAAWGRRVPTAWGWGSGGGVRSDGGSVTSSGARCRREGLAS